MAASTYLSPGVYVESTPGGARPIEAVGTSIAGFLGAAPDPNSPKNVMVWINSWTEFVRNFVNRGDAEAAQESATSTPLSHAVYGYFQNGGNRCAVVNVGTEGSLIAEGGKRGGLDLFTESDEISIVLAPGYTDPASHDLLLSHCEGQRNRVAILDAAPNISAIDQLVRVGVPETENSPSNKETPRGTRPRNSNQGYGAFYFPNILVQDALSPRSKPVSVSPSGHIAGIFARTDATRGVHKAPANEPIRGALDVTYRITREEQGLLNPAGVNCIRFFPGEGVTVYGARTLAPSSSEWRYLNVRRLMCMIEESISRNTRWAVFEPNDRTLWQALKRDVTAFLLSIWRAGALLGTTPEAAFFVKCDEETNPKEEIDQGRVFVMIGVAPVKPAEFVIFRIALSAGESESSSQPS